MHKNPKKVSSLRGEITVAEYALSKLKEELSKEKKLVPLGYELIGTGDKVMAGAIAYEPCNGDWVKAGNSVGKILNEGGYVTGITHRGWRYANPDPKSCELISLKLTQNESLYNLLNPEFDFFNFEKMERIVPYYIVNLLDKINCNELRFIISHFFLSYPRYKQSVKEIITSIATNPKNPDYNFDFEEFTKDNPACYEVYYFTDIYNSNNEVVEEVPSNKELVVYIEEDGIGGDCVYKALKEELVMDDERMLSFISFDEYISRGLYLLHSGKFQKR